MFEFLFGKKIEKDSIMDMIDKYKDDYNLLITYKPDGTIEIFIGTKRKESEEE